MSEGKKYYCFCGSNCKYETMTKEQILAAITQAVETGSVGNCDTGFITKVKEINGGKYVTFWVGTQAQYNALGSIKANCLYIITDDTKNDDLKKTVEQMAAQCEASASAAATAATAAATAAAAVTTIDFSDRLALSSPANAGGQSLTFLQVATKNYIYAPAMKMVFFTFSINFKGKLSKGETLQFMHIDTASGKGIYAPKQNGVSYPATSRKAAFSAEYWEDRILIRVNEDIDTDGVGDSVDISGWYFCDGE